VESSVTPSGALIWVIVPERMLAGATFPVAVEEKTRTVAPAVLPHRCFCALSTGKSSWGS